MIRIVRSVSESYFSLLFPLSKRKEYGKGPIGRPIRLRKCQLTSQTRPKERCNRRRIVQAPETRQQSGYLVAAAGCSAVVVVVVDGWMVTCLVSWSVGLHSNYWNNTDTYVPPSALQYRFDGQQQHEQAYADAGGTGHVPGSTFAFVECANEYEHSSQRC